MSVLPSYRNQSIDLLRNLKVLLELTKKWKDFIDRNGVEQSTKNELKNRLKSSENRLQDSDESDGLSVYVYHIIDIPMENACMHRETLDKKNCEGEGKRKLIKNKKNLNENNEKFEKNLKGN